MKNLVLAALIAASSLSAHSAQPDETYICDGQVVNIKTATPGTIVMDMASIERTGKAYRVVIKAEDGQQAESFYRQLKRTPRQINGATYFFIHDVTRQNTFDFIEIDDNKALGFITDTTGTGNQLQLQCSLK